MANEVVIHIKGDSASAQSAMAGIGKAASGMGHAVSTAVGVVAANAFMQLASAAGTALGFVTTGAVKAASDMSEAVNKVSVVFGESSGAIEAFAATAAQNLGMSRSEAMSAAGTFGNLFVAMGIGQSKASDMSQGILTLAADLGSFNNMDPTEVLEKLRAGLVGETEPLRSLGVNLTAATVEATAMEMGFKKGGGELGASA